MFLIDQLRKNDRALQAVAIGLLAGIGLLLGGLWYVQVTASKRYQANLKNQSFRTVRIPAMRGQILDRNRLALADNRAAFDINLYLEELRDNRRSGAAMKETSGYHALANLLNAIGQARAVRIVEPDIEPMQIRQLRHDQYRECHYADQQADHCA